MRYRRLFASSSLAQLGYLYLRALNNSAIKLRIILFEEQCENITYLSERLMLDHLYNCVRLIVYTYTIMYTCLFTQDNENVRKKISKKNTQSRETFRFLLRCAKPRKELFKGDRMRKERERERKKKRKQKKR